MLESAREVRDERRGWRRRRRVTVPGLGRCRRSGSRPRPNGCCPAGCGSWPCGGPGVPVVQCGCGCRYGRAARRHLARARMLAARCCPGPRSGRRWRWPRAAALGADAVSSDTDRLLVGGEVLRDRAGRPARAGGRGADRGGVPDPRGRGGGARLAEQARRSLVTARRGGRRGVAAAGCSARTLTRASTRRWTRCWRSPRRRCARARRRLAPDGCVLVLVGDLSPSRTLDRVEQALAVWDTGGQADARAEGAADEPQPLLLVDRPGAVQSTCGSAGRPCRGRDRTMRRSPGEPGLRRLLLLAAGGEHPRGQGLHLQPAQPLQHGVGRRSCCS